MLTRVRRDIAQQSDHDGRHPLTWHTYEARVQAVRGARDAVRAGEQGSRYALRQALIDLSACAEALAAPMDTPGRHLTAKP